MATDASNPLNEILRSQTETIATLFGSLTPAEGAANPEAAVQWAKIAARLHTIWTDFQVEQIAKASDKSPHYADPVKWIATVEAVARQLPLADPQVQQKLWEDGLALAGSVLGRFGIGPQAASGGEDDLPRKDPRFADPA